MTAGEAVKVRARAQVPGNRVDNDPESGFAPDA